MPFLPLHDDNPRILVRYPWVTWALILACCAIFWAEASLVSPQLQHLIYGLGMIPATLTGQAELPAEVYLLPPVVTLLTYQFLHGDLLHLVFNMAFVWVFGDNIEDSMGHRRFLVFYLLCGLLAGAAHLLADPASKVPVIGASGAVSGILGAYLVLHPRAKVLVHLVFFIPFYLPAYLLLVFWIGFQVYSATQGQAEATVSVAWWAHIGGFLGGMVLIPLFRHKTIALWRQGKRPSGITMAGRKRSAGKKPPWR